MIVGVAKIKLMLFECYSLKDKRNILNSLITKIRNNYPVSIAEVDKNDIWENSVIGLCIVSNDQSVIDSVFNKIINFIDTNPVVEILNTDIEFIYIN